ncbi:MAG: ABC transporter permease [bacterium]
MFEARNSGNSRARQYSTGFWDRFRHQKSAMAGLMFIGMLVLCSIFSGLFTKYDPNQQGDLITSRHLPPSLEHPFGTDKFARDVFSRVLHGGHISLIIAFSVVILSMTIGVIYGTISGYFGGVIDLVMMRFLDFLLAFPSIFLVITIVAVFHASHWYLIPVLSLTGWMETARIVRAEVFSLKERDFILAAKGLGYSHSRILFYHIIPNCLTPVIVAATLKVGEVILVESALSFLGIGVQPPTPSWGNIINDGREALLRAWWVSTFPGIFIVLVVISFNLIGDALRECLNPGD